MSHDRACPDCGSGAKAAVSRRTFLQTSSALAVATSAWPVWAQAKDTPAISPPESLVKELYDSMSSEQKQAVCYAWDHTDPKRGLLRTHVSNNWHINDIVIGSDFYTPDQQAIIRGIFEGIIQPEWHDKIDRQLEDDAGGYGEHQNIAIFGEPGSGKFELVMTGRHMTLRCDGDSADHVAFGGPIFYGHAAQGFNEAADHPGNVFWPQALAANKVFEMLDGKQRKLALVKSLPKEDANAFRKEGFPGIPVSEMTTDQREEVQRVLATLIEPYRQSDRDEVVACLNKQGGLDACSLAFYQDGDIGNDGVWDCWRLEGPAFVWYFRGAPHVHVWVNVADNPEVPFNGVG